MNEKTESEKSDEQEQPQDGADNKEKKKHSIGGTFTRFLVTIYLFLIRPHKLATEIKKETSDYLVLVRPRTFLLISCMLYSIFLNSIDLGRGHRDTTEAITASLQMLLNNGVSLISLIITTLPILFITAFFAVAAGRIFNETKQKPVLFFIYLYGVQGSLILLYMVTIETQSDILQFLLNSDDYILLIVPTVALVLLVQAIRCFNALQTDNVKGNKLLITLRGIVFFIVFSVPIPLAGYTVITMNEATAHINNGDTPTRPDPEIRIIGVTYPTIKDTSIEFELTALVENRFDKSLVFRPDDVEVEVYFISQSGLNRI